MRVFYDLDSPITLARLAEGEPVPYMDERGLRDYDLVLSYAGGAATEKLTRLLGAKRVEPLYGSVDPEVHRLASPKAYSAALSYLGTHSADRSDALCKLFLELAKQRPKQRSLIGGAQYDGDFPCPTSTLCSTCRPRSILTFSHPRISRSTSPGERWRKTTTAHRAGCLKRLPAVRR